MVDYVNITEYTAEHTTDYQKYSENGIDNLFFFDLRVYIAGVLIPTNSVYITSAFSNLPSATITLPPYKELFAIGRRDKVPVHIFVVNRFIGDSPDNFAAKKTPSGELEYKIGSPLLIFEGFTTGFGYLSDAGGRDFVINAYSTFAFLQDVKVDFIVNESDFNSRQLVPGAFLSSLAAYKGGLPFPLSFFTAGFKTGGASTSAEFIGYPTALIENLFKFMLEEPTLWDGKTTEDTKLKKYYKKYLTTLNIEKRFCKVPFIDEGTDGKPAYKNAFPLFSLLVDNELFNIANSLIQENVQSTGGSLIDIVQSVFSKMEYELAIPSAPTYRGKATGREATLNTIIAKPMFYDALPIKSNVFFRNQIKSIKTDETTHGVPTRIRLKDINRTLLSGAEEGDAIELKLRLDYYPSEFFEGAESPNTNSLYKLFCNELLASEEYTGPLLLDMQAPPWSSWVKSEQFCKGSELDDFNIFKVSLLKSMLMMKIYENRQLTVTLDFNPYVVVGLPAIVFDVIPNGVDQIGLTFIGQVLSTYHSLTKGSLRTNVTLGFVRLIDEEYSPDTRMYNSYEPFSKDISHDISKMNDIYRTLYGGEVIPADTEEQNAIYKSFYDIYYDHSIQNSPRESYEFQERKLCSQAEYFDFMKLKVLKDERTEDGDTLCLQFTDADGSENKFISDRKDGDLIAKLLIIQEKSRKNNIYNKV